MKADGDGTETNFVLAEKLQLEFGIDLPRFQGDSIEGYLQDIAEATPKTMTWKVRRQVAFSIFPSDRMVMHADLDTNRYAFEKNVVISNLFGGSNTGLVTSIADDCGVYHHYIEAKVHSLTT